jgi:methionyl-tRNA formyltransferase
VNSNIDCLQIILITQGVSRIILPFLNSNYNIVGIIEASPRKNSRIEIFFRFLSSKPLKKLADKRSIPYYYMDNGSDQKLQDWLVNLNPDVMIVYSMSQLLKENIFNIPQYGTINLHPSYLPYYRGPNPCFWTYYNMDLHPGVTVHYIDSGEDTGDIIFQDKYEIPLGMRLSDMLDIGINNIGINLLFKSLDCIKTGTITRVKQSKESPTQRARNIKEDEHRNIIDWNNWSVEKIWHLLRGTELWLNAIEPPSGIYIGHRWKIGEFVKNYMKKKYEIGKMYKEQGELFVVCKDGRIFVDVEFNIRIFIRAIIKKMVFCIC